MISIPVHLRPLVVGAGLAVAATVVGMHPGDAVLVGLVVAVLATVWMTLETGESDTWRPAVPEDTAGARRELAVLTWAFLGRDGRVSEAAVRRLRVLATRRLARGGLVVAGGVGPRPFGLDHPTRAAAEEALGERAWRVLTAPGGWMPSLADIAHCVEVIEGLGSAPVPRTARATLPTDPEHATSHEHSTSPEHANSPAPAHDPAGPNDLTRPTSPDRPTERPTS